MFGNVCFRSISIGRAAQTAYLTNRMGSVVFARQASFMNRLLFVVDETPRIHLRCPYHSCSAPQLIESRGINFISTVEIVNLVFVASKLNQAFTADASPKTQKYPPQSETSQKSESANSKPANSKPANSESTNSESTKKSAPNPEKEAPRAEYKPKTSNTGTPTGGFSHEFRADAPPRQEYCADPVECDTDEDVTSALKSFGLTRQTVTEQKVNQFFRQEALKVHPDKTHDMEAAEKEAATERFKQLNRQRDILTRLLERLASPD